MIRPRRDVTRARALGWGAWPRGIVVAALAAALLSCTGPPPTATPEERADWVWGIDKLTRRDGLKALRDLGLHAAAGAVTTTAGRYATDRCGIGFAFAFSSGPGALREVYQIARDSDHAPHLLDRLVDVLGWTVGGLGAWGLLQLGC